MDSKSTTDAGRDDVNTKEKKNPSRPSTSEMVMDINFNANAGEDVAYTPKHEQDEQPSTSEMVMESIKLLNRSNGASVGSIKGFIGKFYGAKINSISNHIEQCLETGVKEGILQQVTKDGGGNRFKIKETANPAIKTNPQAEEIPKKPVKRNPSNSGGFKFRIHNSKSADKGNQPFLPPMVIESIKSLNTRRGAPVDTICRHIEEHYGVNVKEVTRNFKRFLEVGVQKGFLEKTGEVGAEERFKVKMRKGFGRARK